MNLFNELTKLCILAGVQELFRYEQIIHSILENNHTVDSLKATTAYSFIFCTDEFLQSLLNKKEEIVEMNRNSVLMEQLDTNGIHSS